MFFEAKDAKDSDLLLRTYGDEVILTDEGEDSSIFKVLREFRLEDQIYAVLKPSKLTKHEEYYIFRVMRQEHGEVTLETIDHDEEWEAVAEVYDELTCEM